MPVLKADTRRLFNALEKIGSGEFQSGVTSAVIAETLSLVKRGFSEGVDPYGNPWKPLKHREGQPLLNTGRMRAAFQVEREGNVISVENRTDYAAYQNFGTRSIPPRPMVPGDSLPPRWEEKFTALATQMMEAM